MISLGQDEIAKYPFLAEAGQYLKDKGFTLEQFATDPEGGIPKILQMKMLEIIRKILVSVILIGLQQ